MTDVAPALPGFASRIDCRARRGFTLVEVVVAAALGALLLVGVASTAMGLSQSVAQLETDSINSVDSVAARIARQVRYAWWANVPSRSVLAIADDNNRVTEYYRVGNSLLVRLPDGTEGAVLTGLDDVQFGAETTTRLREASRRSRSGTLYGVDAPPTSARGLELKPGTQLAMAFRIGSDGGESSVSGRRENVLSATPTRLEIKIAKGGFTGTLWASIYPARAPDDARPRPGAAALTTVSTPIVALPGVSLREHSYSVGASASGNGVFDVGSVISTLFNAPSTSVSLSLSGFSSPLEPGVAYTIVISVSGVGSLSLVAANPDSGGTVRSDFMMRTSEADSFEPMDYVVPFLLGGEQRVTATDATTVVRQVRIGLTPSSSGEEHVSSAGVYGQIMAEDPWLGVVPDESP